MIEVLLALAELFEYIAVLPDFRRTWKYRHDLHGSLGAEFIHCLSTLAILVASVYESAWVAASLCLGLIMYKAWKFNCIRKHRGGIR